MCQGKNEFNSASPAACNDDWSASRQVGLHRRKSFQKPVQRFDRQTEPSRTLNALDRSRRPDIERGNVIPKRWPAFDQDPAVLRVQTGRGCMDQPRTGKPAEIGALVAWLCSAEAGFVTGQIWTVDGGRMAKLSLP